MRSYLFRLILPFIVLLGSCSTEKRTEGEHERLAPGNWTVAGVQVGISPEMLLDQLGSPTESHGDDYRRNYIYRDQQTTVQVGTRIGGRQVVYSVSGDTLKVDGRQVLKVGQGESEMLGVLRDGYKVERCRQGQSGMWTIPWDCEPEGKGYYYQDDKTLIALSLSNNGTIISMSSELLDMTKGPLHVGRYGPD